MRLFFALWPDEEVRRKLAEAADKLPLREGRRVPSRNLHLTLVFLGNVQDAVEARLAEGAAAIRAAPFVLDFDHGGSFRGSGVAWIAPRETPGELLDLVARLRELCTRCGIATEERPWSPHLTVARKVRRRPPAVDFPPIQWEIKEFCLMESTAGRAGSEYRILRRWPLTVP